MDHSGPEKHVYRWYLILCILMSSLSLLVGFSYIIFSIALINLFWLPLTVAWALFNVVMFFVFFFNRTEKIALWLSGLYVFDIFFAFVMGYIFGFIGVIARISFEQARWALLFVGSILPLVTLCLAIGLLRRKH